MCSNNSWLHHCIAFTFRHHVWILYFLTSLVLIIRTLDCKHTRFLQICDCNACISRNGWSKRNRSDCYQCTKQVRKLQTHLLHLYWFLVKPLIDACKVSDLLTVHLCFFSICHDRYMENIKLTTVATSCIPPLLLWSCTVASCFWCNDLFAFGFSQPDPMLSPLLVSAPCTGRISLDCSPHRSHKRHQRKWKSPSTQPLHHQCISCPTI